MHRLSALFSLPFLFTSSVFAEVIRVLPDADAANSLVGESWENSTNLQRALTLANDGDEIWVASGTYYPDEGQGQTDGNTSASFSVVSKIAILGKFDGSESTPEERDIAGTPPSILSGDISQDDLQSPKAFPLAAAIVGENCNSVITTVFEGGELLLSDLTVVGGDARRFQVGMSNLNGGAIRCENSTLELLRCELLGNRARTAGALYTNNGILTVSGCLIAGNTSRGDGGAAAFSNSMVIIGESIFNSNTAGGDGGAIEATLATQLSFSNCTIGKNACGFRGGALYSLFESSVSFGNTIIWGNSSTFFGAGTNSSIVTSQSSDPSSFLNCIVESSGGSDGWELPQSADLGGNMDTNPLYIPELLAAARSLSLQPYSPAIDTGSEAARGLDLLDRDGDGDTTEKSPQDFIGNSRVFGNSPDIGAKEAMHAQTPRPFVPERFPPNSPTLSDLFGV